MSHYSLEGPIVNAENDRLNRSEVVKPIAAFLRDPSKLGYVVSIEGAWGSGKTSILNLLKELLKANGLEGSNIVHFSPWLVTDAGTMAGEFLKQLISTLALSEPSKILGAAEKKIEIVRKLLKYARYLPIGGVREDLSNLDEALGAAGEAIGATKQEMPDLSGKRAAVIDALKELDAPIIVIIDDVDRLAPKDVYEVIRLVRSIGDFPNVRYVLAMDAGYVEKALEKSQIPEHVSYLDKIFHHRFVIPPVFAPHLRRLLLERLDTIAASDKGLSAGWIPYQKRREQLLQKGLGSILTSLRDVNLVANRVGLMKGLFSEVNFADVVALEALAVKAPSVYRHILQDPSAYTGAHGEHDDRPDFCSVAVFKNAKEGRDRAMGEVHRDLQNAAKELCDALFSEDQATYIEGQLNTYRAREVLEGRVSAPSRLRLAISRTPAQDGITLNLVNRFVRDPGSREAISKIVQEQRGLLRALWLLHAAPMPLDPEAMLRELGRLVDAASAQHERRRDQVTLLATELLDRLRLESNLGGTPILTGKYGVRLAYMEAIGWYKSPKEQSRGFDHQAHGAPADVAEHMEWFPSVPEQMLKTWLQFVDSDIASSHRSFDRSFLREMYDFRDDLEGHLVRSKHAEFYFPPEIHSAVRFDFDCHGRRYFQVRNTSARDVPEEKLLELERREDLTNIQRARLMAYRANGAAVLEHGHRVVDEADLVELASLQDPMLQPAY